MTIRDTLSCNPRRASRRTKHRHRNDTIQNVRWQSIDRLHCDEASLAVTPKGEFLLRTGGSLLDQMTSHVVNAVILRSKAEACWVVDRIAGGTGNKSSDI